MRTSPKWVVVSLYKGRTMYLEMKPDPIRVTIKDGGYAMFGCGTNWAGNRDEAVTFDSWYQAARVAAKIHRDRRKADGIRVTRVLTDPRMVREMDAFRARVRANIRANAAEFIHR